MAIVGRGFFEKSKKWLKAGGLIVAGIVALFAGGVFSGNGEGGISQSNLAPEFQPLQLWRAPAYGRMATFAGDATSLGEPRAMAVSAGLAAAPPSPAAEGESSSDRKLVRSSAMDVIVKNPAEAAEKIRQRIEMLGGYLVSANSSGAQSQSSADLTLRVPAERFEEARGEIRKLGLRVDSERLEAQDVTRQYVDQEARLRNLRAQEQQYLTILKQAHTVKDTLEVSDKLNEVRGEIEQQQAEFQALAKQVETVSLQISLRAETDAQVFGLHWRPLYQLKFAARQGLEGLADYFAAMMALAFRLPAILLWLGTILLGAAGGWRLLSWAARRLFHFPRRNVPANPVTQEAAS
jgi:hypothetical protein